MSSLDTTLVVQQALLQYPTVAQVNAQLAAKADSSALQTVASGLAVTQALVAQKADAVAVFSKTDADQQIAVAVAPLASTSSLNQGLATKANALDPAALSSTVATLPTTAAVHAAISEAVSGASSTSSSGLSALQIQVATLASSAQLQSVRDEVQSEISTLNSTVAAKADAADVFTQQEVLSHISTALIPFRTSDAQNQIDATFALASEVASSLATEHANTESRPDLSDKCI